MIKTTIDSHGITVRGRVLDNEIMPIESVTIEEAVVEKYEGPSPSILSWTDTGCQTDLNRYFSLQVSH